MPLSMGSSTDGYLRTWTPHTWWSRTKCWSMGSRMVDSRWELATTVRFAWLDVAPGEARWWPRYVRNSPTPIVLVRPHRASIYWFRMVDSQWELAPSVKFPWLDVALGKARWWPRYEARNSPTPAVMVRPHRASIDGFPHGRLSMRAGTQRQVRDVRRTW